MDGSKIISMNEAVSMIKSGSTLMIGGFAGSEAVSYTHLDVYKRQHC